MQGAKGTALEWALALMRAPGERHALRGKALPGGVDVLLGIAAGVAPDALAQASRAFGEPEARVREAARFYAREVLFFPGADAYRTLGVNHRDGIHTIKAHYRLLQHWLHPDRTSGHDDAVFAGRVNLAWNQLRTAERRQAYDQLQPWDRPAAVFASDPARQTVRVWEDEDPAPASRWRRRAPVLVLSGICLLLVLLVVRDAAREPGGWDDDDEALRDRGAPVVALQPVDVEEEDAVAPAPERPRNRAPWKQARPAPPVAARKVFAERALASPSVASPAYAAVLATSPASPAGKPNAGAEGAPAPRLRLEPLRSASPVPASPVALRLAEAPSLPPDFLARVRQAEADARRRAQQDAARTQSAHRTGEQLLRYMETAGNPPPPIWNSPLVEAGADGMRRDLRDWGVGRRAGQQWRFEEGTAALVSYYDLENGGDRGQVQLSADFIWRENRWLVTGVSMERVQ